MKEEAKQKRLDAEFDNLEELQTVLQDTMKRLQTGTIDIGKARVIKEVALAIVSVTQTKFVLLKTLSGDGFRGKVIDASDPPLLPEESEMEKKH